MSIAPSFHRLAHLAGRIMDKAISAFVTQAPRQLVPVALLMLANRRLQNLRRRFMALAARVDAGTLPKPRSRPGPGPGPGPDPAPLQPAVERPEGRVRKPRRPAERYPRGFGWAARLVTECVFGGTEMESLINREAEMVALIEAAPQMRRILRPWMWAMGATLPPVLRIAPTARAIASVPEGYVPGPERLRKGVYTTAYLLMLQGWRLLGSRTMRTSRTARSGGPARRQEAAEGTAQNSAVWGEGNTRGYFVTISKQNASTGEA